MSPVPATSGKIVELDGLRGIAILLVIVHHFWPRTGAWADFSSVPHLGWIGVDLFFVISGFLITGILLDTRAKEGYYKNFYVRRALRIFPLYYAFLVAAFIGIPLLQGGFAHSEFLQESGSPAWYCFYLGNIRESITGVEPAYVLAPLWSLSIEEQFYITFPLLVALLPLARLRVFLIGLVVAAPLFRLATMLLWPENERIQYLFTLSRVDTLALGGLLAILVRQPAAAAMMPRSFWWPLAAIGTIAACFSLGWLDRTELSCRVWGYSAVALSFASLTSWTVLNRNSTLTSFLRVPFLMGLGKICYGIYLLQRPCEVALGKVMEVIGTPVDDAWLGWMFVKIGVTIAVATASWFAFEKPILRWKTLFETADHPLTTATDTRTRTVEHRLSPTESQPVVSEC